ncbi:MAG: hypothetical protein UY48_C0003G0057 [Candidatus Gottesmanbacteria bacterium GW2011_GWB1_49_7]|uniref:Uncharacterized protein n=1 Tax=Candidatus Gottesmanbacteria bacterium GW2011_GWB1_49_7 TaxID=1618448 RepID=A0A0G1W3U1_9BACT|nr:MAG: hypothetical protein UY48_C0003G0057 [Candidatus Gottesmanbacteria bacterium GW2011_GWB1_49_7]
MNTAYVSFMEGLEPVFDETFLRRKDIVRRVHQVCEINQDMRKAMVDLCMMDYISPGLALDLTNAYLRGNLYQMLQTKRKASCL